MKIQILSDLHIEFSHYSFDIDPTADVLVLAGDIAPIRKVESVIKSLAENHPKLKIVYILGNHEAYRETLSGARQIASKINIPNVYVLDNSTAEIDGVTFIGSTLWSDIDEKVEQIVRLSVNDYRMIYATEDRLIAPKETTAEFKENKKYITSALEASRGKRVVIVTHHLPSYRSICAKYENCSINSAYASSLDSVIEEYKPLLFIHGHTHSSLNYVLGNTRIVCNPRGYVKRGIIENEQFRDRFAVEI